MHDPVRNGGLVSGPPMDSAISGVRVLLDRGRAAADSAARRVGTAAEPAEKPDEADDEDGGRDAEGQPGRGSRD
ncbi:hypothetical protein GCM10010528_05990 [Gordonia defluvii]|uniref:Uncharacterized protein n=1 Tax=Gordonia defluvii TaxID=283718 RepID=A0ABP6L105_9ACTN